MFNILTIDVEAWYNFCGIEKKLPVSQWEKTPDRLEEGLEPTLRLLEKHRAQATFFTLGYFAQKKPELIGEIVKRGYELGSHGFYHRPAYRQSGQEFAADLEASLNALAPLKGGPILSYRAPEWSLRGETQLEELSRRGIIYDSSLYPVPVFGNAGQGVSPYWIETKAGKVREFPPLTKSSPLGNLPLGGSLPLRIFPYRMLKKRIETLNRQGLPALLYFHPWELDEKIPKIDRFSLRGMAHYAFLSQTALKLERLLGDFPFLGLEEWARRNP